METLPCPWCGDTDPKIDEPSPRVYVVVCDGCGCIGPSSRSLENPQQTGEEAIALWNRRPCPPLVYQVGEIDQAALAELLKPGKVWLVAEPIDERLKKAVEHGGYLATAAEGYMAAVNAMDAATMAADEGRPDEAALGAAGEVRSDHHQGLREAIYEFRKRIPA